VQAAGPPREIPIGKIGQPVATAPVDPDFEKAAVWRIKMPADVELDTDPILRFHYVGDVARVMLNGRFITDDFYNGNAFDISLDVYKRQTSDCHWTPEILPAYKPLKGISPQSEAASAQTACSLFF